MEEEKNLGEVKDLPETNLHNPNYNFVTERKKSKKTLYLVILGIIILTVVGVFTVKTFMKAGTVEPSASPSSTPVTVETPKPMLNKSEISFEVLNGTGVSGLAKKIADQLKDLGYQIVKTGNADKSTYEKTQISVKSDLKDKVDLIIADLKDVIKIASIGGELKDSTASARIILGKD